MKRPDPFLSALIMAVLLASFFPCPAALQPWLSRLTSLLITLMFFFQGVKLQRNALTESLKNWRLQGLTLLITFTVFPLLGVFLFQLCTQLLPLSFSSQYPLALWDGVLFLCCLPSTVQSSIALTSIARGDVPSAICAATLSNILGIFFTPLLTGLILHHGQDMVSSNTLSGTKTILAISRELLLPFILGQFFQKFLDPVVSHHKFLLSVTDRGSIIVMVYSAFSLAVLQGLWHQISLPALIFVTFIDLALLLICLGLTKLAGRLLKQEPAQMIALQFCGSKKSLATGVPMANVLFPHGAGMIILPLMIYHQIQLFICTILARHYAARQGSIAK